MAIGLGREGDGKRSTGLNREGLESCKWLECFEFGQWRWRQNAQVELLLSGQRVVVERFVREVRSSKFNAPGSKLLYGRIVGAFTHAEARSLQ